jgi:hypothetical protein
MQKVFQGISLLGFLILLYFVLLSINPNWELKVSDWVSLNNILGGIGGFAFGVLSLFVGSSEQASAVVVKSISNIGNGWFRIGNVTVNENPQNFPKSKSNSKK